MYNIEQPSSGCLACFRPTVKFADGLELDWRAYELRRSGQPIRLSRIPMELLFLLVERGGELVTRDEIVARIWGKDVFLDTDNSINAAVRKLRQVLDDDPEHPRYLQTVTGMDIASSLRWWKSARWKRVLPR